MVNTNTNDKEYEERKNKYFGFTYLDHPYCSDCGSDDIKIYNWSLNQEWVPLEAWYCVSPPARPYVCNKCGYKGFQYNQNGTDEDALHNRGKRIKK